MVNACLVIVFNHRYDKNIPVLERMYSGRFRHIYFLVPFYDGAHPNVIPVYESSNFFQSYFAQGFHRFFREEFTHYIFLGDDCVLNPSGLAAATDFIPGIIRFHEIKKQAWWHTFKGIDFFNNRKGAEIAKELPSREEAVSRFRKHGVEVQPLGIENVFGTETPAHKKWWSYFLFKQYYFRYKWKAYKKKGKIELPYPVAGSYTDILVITDATIKDFCRYCGIMAAAGLFVEIAIPTSLLLSSAKIMEEKELRLKGAALWDATAIEEVENRYGRSLSSLLNGFPAGQLFYHPVKLSKWKNDL